MNRKAAALSGFYDNWPEVFFVIILIIGFLISLVSRSRFIDYVIILVSGIIVGRLFYIRRHGQKFPLFIISMGYLIGFIFGALISKSGAGWGAITGLYIIGILLSNWIHRKGVV